MCVKRSSFYVQTIPPIVLLNFSSDIEIIRAGVNISTLGYEISGYSSGLVGIWI